MNKTLNPRENTPACRGSLIPGLLYWVPLVLTAVCFAGCLIVELLHVDISKEGRDQIYGIIGTIGFYGSVLLNMAYGRNYGLGWIRSLLFSYLSFRLIFSLVSVTWVKLDIWMFEVGTVASYRSIIFLPLLCVILARFCKVDTLNLCDYLTPYFFFDHGFVTLACWIEGCCAGRPWTWGVLNPLNGVTVFPTQPCIIIASVAVAYWGLHCARKYAYRANGLVFADSMWLYGALRYVIELFSDDARVWGSMSWLSVCSLMMIVLGFAIRCIAVKRCKTP